MTHRVKKALIRAIKGYKKHISPCLIRSCRFEPSCSVYAAEALESHSLLRAITLTCGRVLRCNPFTSGGYDPVPGKGAE